MEKISVTIITLNEEENIRRCLESVKWADEIVVVDSGSSDRTVEICREYDAKVIEREWPGHIQQKNFAIDSAANNWILSLDADEEISPQLLDSIKTCRSTGFDKAGYRMPRRVYYLGRWVNHSGWYPDLKLRLFDRRLGRWGGVNPHDTVIIDGNCGLLSGDLYHYSYRDLAAHARQINSFTSIAAREMLQNGRRPSLANLLLNPAASFFKTYVAKRGFLDGRVGFIIAVMGYFYVFLKYAKFWELYWQKSASATSQD